MNGKLLSARFLWRLGFCEAPSQYNSKQDEPRPEYEIA